RRRSRRTHPCPSRRLLARKLRRPLRLQPPRRKGRRSSGSAGRESWRAGATIREPSPSTRISQHRATRAQRSTGTGRRPPPRAAALFDAASPTAETVGALREGEVLPILETSGGYVRVEDSSGARGWALATDVRPLTQAPRPRS